MVKEFYFVLPEEKEIPIIMEGSWNSNNFLVSAKQYFDHSKKTFKIEKYPFNPKKIRGKVIVDSGAFQYIIKYGDYPFNPKTYAKFLSLLQPTYGVCMDIICEKEPDKYEGKLKKIMKTNFKRIDETVKNCVKNLEYANEYEGYNPVSVVQGYTLEEYRYSVQKLVENEAITKFLGIGSLKQRKKKQEVIDILKTVRNELEKQKQNDIHLHAFGLSFNFLSDPTINKLIDSSDSASWIYSLRKFHRVSIYNPKKKIFHEFDFGFGILHDWKKYASISHNAFKHKIKDIIFMKNKPPEPNETPIKIEDYWKQKRIFDDTIQISLALEKNEKDLITCNSKNIPLYNQNYEIIFFLPPIRNGKIHSSNNLDIIRMQNINTFLRELNKKKSKLFIEKNILFNRLAIWDFLGIHHVKIKLDNKTNSWLIIPEMTSFFKKIIKKHNFLIRYISPVSIHINENMNELLYNSEKNLFHIKAIADIIFFEKIIFQNTIKKKYFQKNYTFHNKEEQIIREIVCRLREKDFQKIKSMIEDIINIIQSNPIHSINKKNNGIIKKIRQTHPYFDTSEIIDFGILTGIFIYKHKKRITTNPRLLNSNYLGQKIIPDLGKMLIENNLSYLLSKPFIKNSDQSIGLVELKNTIINF